MGIPPFASMSSKKDIPRRRARPGAEAAGGAEGVGSGEAGCRRTRRRPPGKRRGGGGGADAGVCRGRLGFRGRPGLLGLGLGLRQLLSDERLAKVEVLEEFTSGVLLEEDPEEAPRLLVLLSPEASPRSLVSQNVLSASLPPVDHGAFELGGYLGLDGGGNLHQGERGSRRLLRRRGLLRATLRFDAKAHQLPAEAEGGAARPPHPRGRLLHRRLRTGLLNAVLVDGARTRVDAARALQVVEPDATVEGGGGEDARGGAGPLHVEVPVAARG